MNSEQIQFQRRLVQEQLVRKPADLIVNRPGKEVWRHAGNPDQMFERLAKNFHWFGRNGNPAWQWASGAGGNTTGKELVSGNVNSTNCGGFNLSVRWVTEHICGINGTRGAYTEASDCFITLTNCTVLDRAWQGSVRTMTHDFHQLKAFFFMGHSWSQLNGQMYDATTKQMGFNNKTDLYWCDLLRTAKTLSRACTGRAYMVRAIPHPAHVPIPGNPPYTCISTIALKHYVNLFPLAWAGPAPAGPTQGFINGLLDRTGSGGGWETFVVLSREHLPPEFRSAVGPL